MGDDSSEDSDDPHLYIDTADYTNEDLSVHASDVIMEVSDEEGGRGGAGVGGRGSREGGEGRGGGTGGPAYTRNDTNLSRLPAGILVRKPFIYKDGT